MFDILIYDDRVIKLSGIPKVVDFVDSKHLFFATEKNVVGSLNPTTGKFGEC